MKCEDRQTTRHQYGNIMGHLYEFTKKDLKMFIRQSFVFEDKRKICVIRVKVDIGDILAIGEHLGAGSFPTTPDHAFLAKVVTWDGRFNLKTAKGTISKKSLTLQE